MPHSPQAGRDETEEKFWSEFENLVQRHSSEEIWIGGDFNAHLGSSKAGFEGVHGGVGLGEKNVEGTCTLDCVGAIDGCVLNTFFQKQTSRLVTYKSGEGKSMMMDGSNG